MLAKNVRTIQKGTIVRWYDTADTIPNGWGRADGSSGTIDMDDFSWKNKNY